MATTYELTACPVCGCSRSRVLARGDDILAEIDALWGYHTRDGRSAPPIDELRDRVAFTHPPPLALSQCTDCGLLYRNPRERFVRELYETETASPAELERLRALQQAAFEQPVRRITRLHGGTGRVLEVGSYVAAFLAAAERAGWHCTGVDVNDTAVAFARSNGHDVRPGGIEAVAARAEYNVVAFWNCFDQLPDPVAALVAARERLRPHGILALRVPNGAFYAALRGWLRVPLVRALLARHNLLGFPYRHGFTTGALRRLLLRHGFEELALYGGSVLPAGRPPARERALRLAERALRPLSGAPWLECYARKS